MVIQEANELLSKFDVDALKSKAEELSLDQSSLDYSDPKYVESVRELAKLNALLEELLGLQRTITNYENSINLLDDPDMKEMAQADINELEKQLKTIMDKVVELSQKPLKDDEKKAIVEIRPGVGGVEASLFAQNLLNMYQKYCVAQGFKIDIYSIDYNEEGGINEAVFLVDEPGSFGKFRFESGVHRVQRVPTTESAGRIHTSTASVVVMPEMPQTEVKIDPKDIRIDVYRSSGPGGQSVNTTDSAVRITHLPTKMIVTSQNSKSQHQNKESAMKILASRLYEIEQQKKQSTEKELRAGSIKGGDRSAKIRTYNFPQGRITDHRIGESWYNIQVVMEGQIGEILNTVSSRLRAEANE